RKSESLFGACAYGVIYGDGGHGSLLIRSPQASVLVSTGDSASAPFQIRIDARAYLLRDRIIERPACLGIRSRNVERPKIAGFHELFADTQRYKRAAAHRNERQQRNDQPVSIFEGVRLDMPLAASASATARSMSPIPSA